MQNSFTIPTTGAIIFPCGTQSSSSFEPPSADWNNWGTVIVIIPKATTAQVNTRSTCCVFLRPTREYMYANATWKARRPQSRKRRRGAIQRNSGIKSRLVLMWPATSHRPREWGVDVIGIGNEGRGTFFYTVLAWLLLLPNWQWCRA